MFLCVCVLFVLFVSFLLSGRDTSREKPFGLKRGSEFSCVLCCGLQRPTASLLAIAGGPEAELARPAPLGRRRLVSIDAVIAGAAHREVQPGGHRRLAAHEKEESGEGFNEERVQEQGGHEVEEEGLEGGLGAGSRSVGGMVLLVVQAGLDI